MILYFCPDVTTKSAGIRILYRHVALLVQNGMSAAILHRRSGFVMPDVPAVPVRYLSEPAALHGGDIVVIPEGWATIMRDLRDLPIRRFAIALNWKYAYHVLHGFEDWRSYGIERILTHSPFIADFLSWAMGLPSHVITWAISADLFFFDPREKTRKIVYIARKGDDVPELQRVLHSRRAEYVTAIEWKGLDGLGEAEYAREVRTASVFLNLSPAEGLPCSALEAMRAGTLVAGYHSVGGQRELVGSGPQQNCILADNLDYATLAQRLAPILDVLIAPGPVGWQPILDNAAQTSARYTRDAERCSLLEFWQSVTAPKSNDEAAQSGVGPVHA